MRPAAGGGFFVEMVGVEEAAGFFSELQHELKQGLRDRLKEAAGIVSRDAAERTTSARVKAAMGFNVEVNSLVDFQARIGPSRRRAWFAHFLEFGTKAHMETRGASKDFIGPRGAFSHPGSRAFPFLAPALAATEDQVVELVGFPPILQHGGSR